MAIRHNRVREHETAAPAHQQYMTTTPTATDTEQLALVVDLFGSAATEPAPAARSVRAPRTPRRRSIGDTSSACARCHPEDPAARYGSCFVCAPAQIALG